MNRTGLIYVVLVLIPTVPLLLAWRVLLIQHDSPPSSPGLTLKSSLLVTTASCLLFLSGLFFPPVIGPDYSNRRFATIWVNLGVVLLVVILSLRVKNRLKIAVAIAAGAVALVWLYAWGMSAAV